MTPEHVELTQALIVLVVQWRERADQEAMGGGSAPWSRGIVLALERCADELEAVLVRPGAAAG
jgi:hypothetical protein